LADKKGLSIPVTGINKKTWFKAEKSVDHKTMVLKKVELSSPRRLEELKHCGNPKAVGRETHGTETLTTKQEKDLFSVRINCVGLHSKELSSMIVVIEAQTNETKEKLRSEPFILCPRRNERDLKEAYEQKKVELHAASYFLSQATDSSTPAPVPTSQSHQNDLRANSLPTTLSNELALPSTTNDDLFDMVDNLWSEYPSDFIRSRFSN